MSNDFEIGILMKRNPTLTSALVLAAIASLTVPLSAAAQSILTNWDGGNNTDGKTPPDPHGAAGPSGVVGTYNVSVTYYDKAGGIIWGPTNLQNFFAAAGNTGQGLADPKVLYDRYSGRFFLIHQETTTNNHSFLNLAVSKNSDPRSTSTADWAKYRLEMAEYSGGTTNGGDYPGFGLDSQGVYVSYNMFAMTNGTFIGKSSYSQLLLFNKAEMIAGGTVSFSSIDLNGSTLQPATPLDSSGPANRLYLIQSPNRTNLVLWAVDDPLGAATVNSITLTIPDNGGGPSNKAPQAGVTNVVDVLDIRAQAAVYVRGNLCLAITAGPAAGPSQVYYYRVNPYDFPSASLIETVESGPLGEAGYWNYQPAIGGNFAGDLAVVYTRSSSTSNPAMMYCFRSATDSAFSAPQVVVNSGGPSVTTGSKPWRWGDFAAVSADPVDGSLWITHEYARSGAANNWGTWFAEISVPFRWTWIGPGQTNTFNGNASLGTNGYDIAAGWEHFINLPPGGCAHWWPDGGADGGKLELIDSASGADATIRVDGGPLGYPGHLDFHGNATASDAKVTNLAPEQSPVRDCTYQTFGQGGETLFWDYATAGTAQIVNLGPYLLAGGRGATTGFADEASADHAEILNQGATRVPTQIFNAGFVGGTTGFTGNSHAGHAKITNLNSVNGTQYSNGRTVFWDTAHGDFATITNIGGDAGFLEMGGTTEFRNTSSAENATVHSFGGTGGSFPGPGTTAFYDTATAANGSFINYPGYSSGGNVIFYEHSSAGDANFINDSPNGSIGGAAGLVQFRDDTVAGQGHFTTTGYYGGHVDFRDRSSADHGMFLVDANVYDGRITFISSSTADHGTFQIGGGGQIQFQDSATASNAVIVLHANGTVGKSSFCGFSGNATAGNANITVMGAEIPGMYGASLGVQGPATLGNATIAVNGASVTTFGASGGQLSFSYGGSLGAATFIINGGTNGGAGGSMRFNGVPADHAHIILNAGGSMDVSGVLDNHVGSLEGAGNVWIDHALLAVGALSTDTTFSGVISGRTTPPLGAFTKEGTGTLTLAGTNTFKGLTTVAAGTLVVSGSLASDVQVNGGATLKGVNHIAGNVTVLPGGIVAPGNSPGTLTIGGNYSQQAGGMLELEVAGPNPQNQDHLIVNSNLTLSGKLLLVFSGYAPSATDNFTLLEAGGNLTVNNLEVMVLGLKPGYQPNYQVSAGKLILTAPSSGQLRTIEDPVQTLSPWFTPQSGFVFPVFTIAGATYQFDTSTDLKNWTGISQVPGANVLVEFRNIPSNADARRFYRLVQTSGTP